MKQWIEHHKRILQKAASALLAFMVGVCLVFMIHPVKTLPKDRLLSLSRVQEDSPVSYTHLTLPTIRLV